MEPALPPNVELEHLGRLGSTSLGSFDSAPGHQESQVRTGHMVYTSSKPSSYFHSTAFACFAIFLRVVVDAAAIEMISRCAEAERS